jgi:hypothetical protein
MSQTCAGKYRLHLALDLVLYINMRPQLGPGEKRAEFHVMLMCGAIV